MNLNKHVLMNCFRGGLLDVRQFMVKRLLCNIQVEKNEKGLIRATLDLDSEVNKSLEDGVKHKHHPGKRVHTAITLPERFVKAAFSIVNESKVSLKVLEKDAIHFQNQLNTRLLPATGDEVRIKAQNIYEEIVYKDAIDVTELDEETKLKVEQSIEDKVSRKMKTETYNWKPIEYSKYNCLLHLYRCFASNYATTCKIFSEIKTILPEYQPKTLLDFGSGVGATLWTAHEAFKGSLVETLCIDTSPEMNEMSQLLLQDGKPEAEPWLKKVFYKEFLPPSNLIKYDLVVCGHTLLQMPSSRERLQIVNNLWNKTQDMLVIIEHGSFSGHTVVIEARDFILNKSNVNPLKKTAFVLAPCQHDFPCPKSTMTIKRPCSFPAKYHPLSFYKEENPLLEKYSYIVLSKKNLKEHSNWPRIISRVSLRPRHLICRLCNTDGKLYECTVTKAKNGRHMYRCARSSSWGDLIPGSVVMKSEKTDKKINHATEEDSESDSDCESKKTVFKVK